MPAAPASMPRSTVVCALSRLDVREASDPTEGPAFVHEAVLDAIRAQDVDAVRRALAQALTAQRRPGPTDSTTAVQALGPAGLWRPAMGMDALLQRILGRTADEDHQAALDRIVTVTLAEGSPDVVGAVLERLPLPAALPWIGRPGTWPVLLAHGVTLDAAGQHAQLHRSVQAGRIDLVDLWLANGARLTTVSPATGQTVLHTLVERSCAAPEALRRAMLDHLLDQGAHLEQPDDQGRTALLVALAFEHGPDRAHDPDEPTAEDDRAQMRLVRTLLDRGADVQARSAQGSVLMQALTPLGWSSGVVSALVERGAVLRRGASQDGPGDQVSSLADAWGRALRSQEMGLVELCLILSGKQDLDRIRLPSWWGTSRGTVAPPLVLAACQGFTAAVDRLVDAGADVQAAIDHPFWSEQAFMANVTTNLCREILLPGGSLVPDQEQPHGMAVLERAALRQVANRVGADAGTAPTKGDGTAHGFPNARRARL